MASTTAETALTALSKDIGDYWAGTTSAVGSSTTIVDAALKAKANDWITDEAYGRITSATTFIFIVTSANATVGATYTNNSVTFTVLATIAPDTTLYCSATSLPAASGTLTKATGTGDTTIAFSSYSTCEDEERKISSLANTSGTLTMLAHSGIIATGTTYEVHRLFSASDKKTACIEAAKNAYPSIYKLIRDENLVVGNWLRNGSAEVWTLTTVPDHWVTDTVTQTENTTKTYISVGSSSAKITGAAGGTYQSTTENEDLWDLAGNAVTVKVDVWCDTASKARLRIYDGTTTTNGDYHDGDSVMTELSVAITLASSCSEITFTIRNETASGNIYWDNARVIGPTYNKIYVGDLGLLNHEPHQILQQSTSSLKNEPWQPLRGWEPDYNGYIYLPEGSQEYRLRIIGMGYLDFLASGVASTTWAATIAIGEPQIRILTAYAAKYLYQQMILPDYDTGTSSRFAQAMQYWEGEIARRSALFGMPSPAATRDWAPMGRRKPLLRQVES